MLSDDRLKCYLSILCFVILYGCQTSGSQIIGPGNPVLSINGRVLKTDSALIVYWSGTSVSMDFEGEAVDVLMKDEMGLNYFYLIIDSTPGKIRPTKDGQPIRIDKLTKGRHRITLFKLTEGSHGKTWFYGFRLADGAKVFSQAPKKHKIEFYGNSITAGYSIEDTLGDSKAPGYFNNYLTYAAITARHFDADYYCIAKSGIGVTVSWFPVIMPELYDRLDPGDSLSKWNFSNYTPDVVVVNLMTNDLFLMNMPNNDNFKKRFGLQKPGPEFFINAYKNFVLKLRATYPNSYIICTSDAWQSTDLHGDPYPDFITPALRLIADPKVLLYHFDYSKMKKNVHPKIKDNEAMAAGLIGFIEQNVRW